MSMADVLISHDEEHLICGVAETSKGWVWIKPDNGAYDLIATVDHLGDMTVVEGLRAAGYTDGVLRDLHRSGSVEDLRSLVGILIGDGAEVEAVQPVVEQPKEKPIVLRVCDVLGGTDYDESALYDVKFDVGMIMLKTDDGDREVLRAVYDFLGGALRGYRRISDLGDLHVLRDRVRADIEACRRSEELSGREVVMCVVDDLLGHLIGESVMSIAEAELRFDRLCTKVSK